MALSDQDKREIIDAMVQGVLQSLQGVIQESIGQARSVGTLLGSSGSNEDNPNPPMAVPPGLATVQHQVKDAVA